MRTGVLFALLVTCSPARPSFGQSPHPAVPWDPVLPEGLGVNIHFRDPRPGEMKMLAGGGFRWVRMDFTWSLTEKERGKYDFGPYDRLTAALGPHKIRALFILDYANNLYDKGLSPHTDEGRTAFARWASAAAKHFKGRGILWEMYNEPNIRFWKPRPNVDHYVRLAIEVGKAIRRAAPEEAYIGPGAGFALLSSFLVLFAALALALISLLSWPVRGLFRLVRRRRAFAGSMADRVIVVGLDGLDPVRTERLMAEGKLPNLSRLRQIGTFRRLQTTTPAVSPVAWSTFSTGVNPGRHNVFDFLTRDPKTYLPGLSSARIQPPGRKLNIGRYVIPLGRPQLRLLRRSRPFWAVLGDHGIFSAILRVPITFPPERFRGVLLSAMCVPDLQGSQGTFSFYTTSAAGVERHTGGVRMPVRLEGDRVEASLIGPPNPFSQDGAQLRLPFALVVDETNGGSTLRVAGQRIRLGLREYSPWVRVAFRAGLGAKVRGICRFYLKQVAPDVELYVTPIQIDPDKPALPISHPFVYAIYLAKLLGSYATLGLAEDTWALNERVLDDDAFIRQCWLIHDERERMFFDALDKTRRGACVCVFDVTDRLQHMFYRYEDDAHPALRGADPAAHRHLIDSLYERMDDLVGRVLDRLGERSVLIVMSDHGFASFRRGINLNSWLARNGYLALREGAACGEWFANVDWAGTRAYALGLGGVYLNRRGREAQGIVAQEQVPKVKEELIAKLSGLRDDETGQVAIREVFDSAALYHGPYAEGAPDLIVGYNAGYRASWEGVTGKVDGTVFSDNTRSWSGDHSIDPRLVPGCFFSSRPISAGEAAMADVAPTILHLFGVPVPAYMEGAPLFASAGGPGGEMHVREQDQAG